MSDLKIRDRKDLVQAKQTLRKRLDRREVLVRSNLAYFQDRWQDERLGGTFSHKNIVMDALSVTVDAIYVLKAGTKDKTRLLIRFMEVGVHYLSQRYLGHTIQLLKQIIPFMKAGAQQGAKWKGSETEEEGEAD